MKRYIRSSYTIFTEYDNQGDYVQHSTDADALVTDTKRFGGCVVDQHNNFIGGDDQVYSYYGRYFKPMDSLADDEEYIPSATRGDYSPSNPWDAPGMSIHDFI